ncbi:MAG TPA: hypothetical protein VGV37_12120 [Aliidongia sp.]|uniref:hypothetical protein n=1 Tax=Aliidongia sp. TaxID=1914230 RepID=UPI002DDCEC1C|nr:hypothetical protein [Aliidongia sp.]HEV2675280.1 hypothetical protein [Aliidongia sp.]
MTDLKLQYVIEAIDRSTAVVTNIGKRISAIGESGARGFERMTKSAETVQGAIAGIGLGIAAEMGAKEIVRTAEYFDRLRITSGASHEAIDRVKESLIETAGAARINSDELTASFKSMKDNGATLQFFQDNIEGVARNIQLLGGHGDELGESWAVLARNFNLFKPEDLSQAFSTLRAQLVGIDGGFVEMAPKLGRLSAAYRAIGQTGLGASRDLGALFAIVRLGTASSREAVSQVSSLIGYFNDKGGQDAIASLGVPVFANEADRRARKVRPVPDIINDIARVYQQNPAFVENRLGSGFINPLKVGFGELQTNGSLTTLNQKRGITGNVEGDQRKADQIAKQPTAVLNAILDQIKGFWDSIGALALEGTKLFGDDFIKFVAGATNVAGSVLAIGAAVKYLGPLVQLGLAPLRLFAASLPTIALRIGLLAEAVGAGGLADAFVAVGAAIAATPIGWVMAGIVAIAGGAYLVYSHWKPIKEFFARLWEGLKHPDWDRAALAISQAGAAEAGLASDPEPAPTQTVEARQDDVLPMTKAEIDAITAPGRPSRSFLPQGRTILGAGDGQHLPLGPQRVEITLKFQDAPGDLALVDKRSSSGSVDVQLDPSFGVSLGSVP